MLKFMLDTGFCAFTLLERPQHLRDAFGRHHGQMCISTITLMQLAAGAEKSSSPEHNLAVVEGFAARLEVLSYDELAAMHTGQLSAELARDGREMETVDRMVAGHARSKGLILVTNKHSGFDIVPGLRIEHWLAPST